VRYTLGICVGKTWKVNGNGGRGSEAENQNLRRHSFMSSVLKHEDPHWTPKDSKILMRLENRENWNKFSERIEVTMNPDFIPNTNVEAKRR